MSDQCPATTKAGRPCGGTVLPGKVFCFSHDPETAEARMRGARKGGYERATHRRAVKQWVLMGEQMRNDDLPSILRASMIAVRDGDMTPGEAQAIASLARASMQVTADLEMESRIAALEEAAGVAADPPNVRRWPA